MKRFCKKPEYVEAVQWDETQATFNILLAKKMPWARTDGHTGQPNFVSGLRIWTGPRAVDVNKGDWIVIDSEGKFKVLWNGHFHDAYDPIKEDK